MGHIINKGFAKKSTNKDLKVSDRAADSFKFKIAEDLYFDFYHCFNEESVDINTVYTAKKSETNENEFIVSWFDKETNSEESTDYKRETVEEALKEGSWILFEEKSRGEKMKVIDKIIEYLWCKLIIEKIL